LERFIEEVGRAVGLDSRQEGSPIVDPRGVLGLGTLVRILALAYLGYVALLFVLQRSLLFPGTRLASPHALDSAPLGVEQVWLGTSFGRVEAWFFDGSDGAPTATLIFAHGNGELIDHWRLEMEDFSDRGVNVLLVEFPGYGHSEGKPTRATLHETFTQAYDWLIERPGVDPERVDAWGRSIGGGVASDLALSRPVKALILQSTFSSMAALARRSFGAPGFLLRDRYDVARDVAEFEGPVLLIHGTRDEVIPYPHAERIAGVRDGLEVVALDCGHNDCAPLWGEIRGRIARFLEISVPSK